ncbi:RNA-directed DNA polymerase [Litchfieldella qijiaojingensis]|uniref:RNA-directed DNA polymerase n=1 Tax=Litchfieldella qijiaojingensis TaxID=980347 RepID=A0ABQ2YZC4_9GAMM|nr:retron St85 family RNA-directed DNA polymerase [Halomonas qijiaojingensis]GGX98855.1 RNA-directed DNA polymerase [Halomonas qijiaojingensis]
MDESRFRQLLKDELSISFSESARLIARAPHAYKVYRIKKVGGGYREISQPAKETKFVMHWLVGRFFEKLPVHECATAYSSGSSIKKNAIIHAEKSYIAKFDFKDFFPSITKFDVEKHLGCFNREELDGKSLSEIARLCTVAKGGSDNLCLSIGSPASPVLSNSIMYAFDRRIYEWCCDNSVVYSRYADDLTFSTNVKGLSFELPELVRTVLDGIEYPSISLNNEKTVFASKKGHRRVTGLVLSNPGKVSLGRKRKREISALIHKFSVGALSKEDLLRLQGLLGFVKDVEPLFVEKMISKYGYRVIVKILSFRKD